MSVKLLTEHDLEFLSLTGSCTGSYESTLVKMPHCWKSNVTAQLYETVNQLYLTGAHAPKSVSLYTIITKIIFNIRIAYITYSPK